MKLRAINLAVLAWFAVGSPARAADVVLLHTFARVGSAMDTPAALAISGSTLIGTSGGTDGTVHGTVFQLGTDGTGFSVLHTFHGGDNDGASPTGSLLVSEGKLYGVTGNGGGAGDLGGDGGTAYVLDLHGATFALLHRFVDPDKDGASPIGGLTRVGSMLYGMTEYGGGKGDVSRGGAGLVYRLNLDGSSFTQLHAFAGGADDGANPLGHLTSAGSNLYGLAQDRGRVPDGDGPSDGVLFKIGPDGSPLRVLHRFSRRPAGEGTTPEGSLEAIGTDLYGTTASGGPHNGGAPFRFDVRAGTVTSLPGFDGGTDRPRYPGDLTGNGAWLYGSAVRGGADDLGCLYRVRRDGTEFELLHSFAGGPADGANPCGPLIVTDSALYGIALHGGPSDAGCVFKVARRADP